MVPRNLSLPKPGPLRTEKVRDGLYVVRGAYAQTFDYFASSRLYAAKEEPEAEPSAEGSRAKAG
jgi:hypothetical protein